MREPRCLFQCVNCKQRVLIAFHPPGFQIKVPQYTAIRYITITIETAEEHGNFNIWFISFSIRSNVTGQHDRQDERLTGQLSNQSGHCPLTGRYFEPWVWAYRDPQRPSLTQRLQASLPPECIGGNEWRNTKRQSIKATFFDLSICAIFVFKPLNGLHQCHFLPHLRFS